MTTDDADELNDDDEDCLLVSAVNWDTHKEA